MKKIITFIILTLTLYSNLFAENKIEKKESWCKNLVENPKWKNGFYGGCVKLKKNVRILRNPYFFSIMLDHELHDMAINNKELRDIKDKKSLDFLGFQKKLDAIDVKRDALYLKALPALWYEGYKKNQFRYTVEKYLDPYDDFKWQSNIDNIPKGDTLLIFHRDRKNFIEDLFSYNYYYVQYRYKGERTHTLSGWIYFSDVTHFRRTIESQFLRKLNKKSPDISYLQYQVTNFWYRFDEYFEPLKIKSKKAE